MPLRHNGSFAHFEGDFRLDFVRMFWAFGGFWCCAFFNVVLSLSLRPNLVVNTCRLLVRVICNFFSLRCNWPHLEVGGGVPYPALSFSCAAPAFGIKYGVRRVVVRLSSVLRVVALDFSRDSHHQGVESLGVSAWSE